MGQFTKYAAIVPLAYDSATGEKTTEDSVVYANGNWEDLASLLEAPMEFLRGEQFVWSQRSGTSVAWQLLTPLSATIECGYSCLESFYKAVTLLGEQIRDYITDNVGPTDSANFIASDFSSTWDGVEKFSGLIQTFFEGSFIVEFNTYTSSIRILYFPPNLADTQSSYAASGPRYQGSFLGPSLIASSVLGRTVLNLHLDLDQESSRMRADFVMGYLENPDWLMGALTTMAKTNQVVGDVFNLVQAQTPKSELMLPAVPMATIDKHTTFTTADPFAATACANSTAMGTLLAQYAAYPAIQLNNLSMSALTQVCENAPCVYDAGTKTVYVGDSIIESYQRVLYDPCSVVNRCGNREP